MFELLRGLLTLALLGAFCLNVAACTRYSAAALPLPTLAGSAVVLYLAGCLGVLPGGLFVVYGILLAGAVYFGFRAGMQAIREAVCNPGFLLFVGGAAFLWVLFWVQKPLFTQWDEFTAWGLAPKMVQERGAFYVADPINLTASFTYPGTSLISYFFQTTPRQFSEWQCLAALDILFLACIAPVAALPRSRWAQGTLLFGAGVLLPFAFSVVPLGTPSTVYANAMADTPLALLFGGSLCLYFAVGGRKTGFCMTALPLALLAMIKDIGLAYGMMAVFLIGLDQLFGTEHPADRSRLRIFGIAFGKALGLAAVVAAVFVSWNRYTALVSPGAGAASVGSSQLSYGAVLLGGVKQLLGIGRDERFGQIMSLMFRALWQRQVCLLGAPLVAVLCILLVSAAAFVTAPRGADRRRVLALTLGAAFCFVALYLFHTILYYYNFSELEGLALKDYERYIGPYLMGWLLAALCLLGRSTALTQGIPGRAASGVTALSAAAVVAVFCWRGIPTAGFWSDASSIYTVRQDVKNRAAVMNEVLDWDDRVLVISQGDDATRWYYYKYELTAKVVDGYGGIWWGDDDYSNRWDSDFMNLVESLKWDLYDYKAVCSADSLVAYMAEKDCDYLLIDRADDYLERDFSDRFEGGLTAEMPATLYRFLGADQQIAFAPAAVAESGVEQ